MTRLAVTLLTFALLATSALAADAPGNLRLLPADHPASPNPKDLANTRWLCAGIRDIIGRGQDQLLSFHTDGNGTLQLDVTTRRWPSVNDKQRQPQDHTSTYPCTFDGPIIRYGPRQQTFYLDPGKTLVLNALLPLGHGRWYIASTLLGVNGQHREEELLLEFTDDPRDKDQGKGLLRARTGTSEKILEQNIEFILTRNDKHGRILQLTQSGGNRVNWGSIYFPLGASYAQLVDDHQFQAQVFVADKSDPSHGN